MIISLFGNDVISPIVVCTTPAKKPIPPKGLALAIDF
jgi:hypothetical protein